MGLPCLAQRPHAPLHTYKSCIAPHPAAGGNCRRSLLGVTRASSSTQTPGSSHAAHHTYERVLRYPDGNVRYIRYPVAETVDEEEEDFAAWDVSGLWSWSSARPVPRSDRRSQQDQLQLRKPAKHQQLGHHAQQPEAATPEHSLADTAAFLESLFAAPMNSRPVADVEGSYEVLHGCPWPLPRPVYVLCVGTTPRAEDVGSTYTLQVRVKQEGAASDIAKLLGKQHLQQALEVSQLQDGLLMFEREDSADRFSMLLEEEGYSQVMVAQVDSHKLFRMAADVRGLVVLVKDRDVLPTPYQLAAALKQSRSWDER